MSVDSVSSLSHPVTDTNASKLVQTASGEYTSDSVMANFKDAAKLGLVRAKDGNYVRPPIISSPDYASAQSTPAVQEALTTLPFGGR